MNKITSILFLYITFLPAFSYAAFPDNIMTGMDGVLYTNQSAHATNTDEYVANFAPNPSLLSTDTNTQQQYKEQFEEPINKAIDLCEKSGGDWEQNTCNCEKYGMEYDKPKLRCTHPEIPSEKRSAPQLKSDYTAPQLKSDYTAPQEKEVKKIKTYDATTSITVSVVDHYDSSKKIKGITVCYTNDGSCKTTERNGIITFTQHHHKNESITPQITVKGSDEYECNTPIDTTDKSVELSDELYELQHKTKPTANQHQFIIKCKKIEKQKSKKEKNQTKQDQEVTITIVNYYNESEKIQGVKICTDTDKKDCKKTNKNGTITIKSGEQISIDSDYECNPQIANVTNNETIKCKQKCTDKDLKKVPNATACYVRGKKDYEILRCAADYTNIDNKCEPNPKLPVEEKIGKVNLTKTSEQKKLEEQVKQASKEQIKKLTKETIDKINNYCKEEENKNVCDKQDETIKAINEAQDTALKKLNEQQ